jgi:hypothetical protein
MSDGIKAAHAIGKYKGINRDYWSGKNHTKETKDLISEKARASKHRRLLRSVRDYIKTDGTVVKLDSSWEEILARRLDEINVNWIRPDTPIEWIDKHGKSHNYFPDFYLVDYDLFLDPKNQYAYTNQLDKIEIITKQMKNLLILRSEKECRLFDLCSFQYRSS